MAQHSPIQVVLNTNNFIENVEAKKPGPSTDFFEGNDKDFVMHKETISQQLQEVRSMQLTNKFAPVSYAKVTLRQSALAKSHRPSNAIFKKDVAPIVGAGDLGELFVELTPESIDKVTTKIDRAETTTRWKEVNGKTTANPTRLRSEVGAIDKIVPHTESDKRKFSTQQAVEWLSDPQSGGGYIVELFDNPPPKKDWDTLNENKYKLFKSFIDGLEGLGSGLSALKIKNNKGSAILFGIKLENSSAAPVVQLAPVRSSLKNKSTSKDVNLDVNLHNNLLTFLDIHPLVRKIMLPPKISKSISSCGAASGEATMPEIDSKTDYPKLCIVDGGVSDIYGEWIEDQWGLLSSSDKDEAHGTFIAGLAIVGKTLNGHAVCKESDGCKVIDLDILPKDGQFGTYFPQILDFFNELDIAVQELKARTGVRIFNFSLNIEEHASTTGYSVAAQFLDKIAEDNDVVFVISAGNTHPLDVRKEWSPDPVEVLKTLAASRNDTIKQPAESCRNVSVSALNPPNIEGIVSYGLSN